MTNLSRRSCWLLILVRLQQSTVVECFKEPLKFCLDEIQDGGAETAKTFVSTADLYVVTSRKPIATCIWAHNQLNWRCSWPITSDGSVYCFFVREKSTTVVKCSGNNWNSLWLRFKMAVLELQTLSFVHGSWVICILGYTPPSWIFHFQFLPPLVYSVNTRPIGMPDHS